MASRAAGVFISYRREDSPGHAGRIFDRLRERFGDRVFMDVDGIEAGVDFVAVLERALGSCNVLLAVVGPEWIAAADRQGRARLSDPNDFVRLEVSRALERDIRVIPVLVDGAVMPATQDLPEQLQPLSRRQAIELRDARWGADIEQLVSVVGQLVSEPTTAGHSAVRAASTSDVSTRAPWPRGARMGAVVAGVAVLIALAVTLAPRVFGPATPTMTATPQTDATPAPAAPTPTAQPPTPSPGVTATPAATPAPRPAPDVDPPDTLADDTPDISADTPSRASRGGAAGPVASASIPNVVGEPITKARELLASNGLRHRTRLVENRAVAPGIVQAQNVMVGSGPGDRPVVVLTTVATSTILIHYRPGDVKAAEELSTYLRRLRSTSGSIIRTQQIAPRAEVNNRVAYSEDALAPQAEAIAKDASAFIMKTYGGRPAVEAVSNRRIAIRTLILRLPALNAR
jgi:hypothetical protein